MRLTETKAEIKELLSKLESAIEVARGLGLRGELLELLEDQEWYLQRLIEHIEALEDRRASLSLLERELRETKRTLVGLKETLLLYDDPNSELISKIDSAKAMVNKNLGKVRRGRSALSLVPVLALGGLVVVMVKKKGLKSA